MNRGLHLVIDGFGARHSGAATVLKAVVVAVLKCKKIAKLTVFTSQPESRNFALPISSKMTEISYPDAPGVKRIWWLAKGLSKAICHMEANVLLCLGNGGIVPRHIPTAVFIQQSIPFEPEAIRLLGLADRLRMVSIRVMMYLSCRRASSTIVQSPTMKKWVSSRFRIPRNLIKIIQPAIMMENDSVDLNSSPPVMRTAKPGCRLLYVGSLRPHKNIPVLLDAVARVRHTGLSATLFVTCPQDHPICAHPGIIGVGYLNDDALWGAYCLADALVMPSIVETVGLPMLEAASVGVPIIAADRPYAHDTCEDAAIYFNPTDPVDLAEKLKVGLTNTAIREMLSRNGFRLSELRRTGKPYEQLVTHVVSLSGNSRLGRTTEIQA